MDYLKTLVERVVNVLTLDGRTIIGTLKGYDHIANLILTDSFERVFSPTEGVETVLLGLYVVRGENIAVIGEVDEEMDASIDWSNTKGQWLPKVAHGVF